jgi:hypothetical protein
MARTPTLSARVQPETMAAIEQAAKDEGQSTSSLIEKIIVRWLREHGYLAKGQLNMVTLSSDDDP